MYLVGRWAPLANGALCLSTHKHNGKSGTGERNGTTKVATFDCHCKSTENLTVTTKLAFHSVYKTAILFPKD